MNAWRVAITSFILVLLTVVTLGFVWTSRHQPPAARLASQVVLGISGLAGVLAVARLWRPRGGSATGPSLRE